MKRRWRGAIRWRGRDLPYVRAERATALILDAIDDLGTSRVAVPALYCMETAGALIDAGVSVHWYDLSSDLSPDQSSLDRAVGAGAAIVWFHPFGFYRPPPPNLSAKVIVDACHAFRTLSGMNFPLAGAVTVFNLRKEFGWRNSALAIGSSVEAYSQGRLRGVDRRLACIEPEASLWRGEAQRALLALLGPKVPRCSAIEIPTFLPMLSMARDDLIARCQSRGFEAWRWLTPPPAAALEQCPTVARLRPSLLLVRPPPRERLDELVETLRPQELLDWPTG